MSTAPLNYREARPGRATIATVRECFELAAWMTPSLSVAQLSYAPADRGSGRTYREPATEAAYRAFLVGFRCRERINAKLEERVEIVSIEDLPDGAGRPEH